MIVDVSAISFSLCSKVACDLVIAPPLYVDWAFLAFVLLETLVSSTSFVHGKVPLSEKGLYCDCDLRCFARVFYT